MRLTISNIAWPDPLEAEVLELLPEFGVTAIEMAPTRIWPDWTWTPLEIDAYRACLHQQGLKCSSLQSIVYQKPDLKVFGTSSEQKALLDHLRQVADLAVALGARPLVFGAPKNRDRGDLDEKAAFVQAVDFFAEIADYCHRQGVCLCIEPNPVAYACNFITESQSGAELVRAVNSPGFRLHLDAAGMHLAGEEAASALERAMDVLEHIHISELNLGDFSAPQVDHALIAQTLRSVGWDKWLSIEMRTTEQPIESIQQALDYVKTVYKI